MNKILKKASILFLISFSLFSCGNNDQKKLKDVEKHSGINYLSSANIVFSYTNITGFEDRAGPVYYVLDFSNSNKKEQFINQYFFDKRDKSGEFEAAINKFVQEELGGVYYTFDKQYQLDLEAPYSYYYEENLFLIYYQETSIVYFLYHLWIP